MQRILGSNNYWEIQEAGFHYGAEPGLEKIEGLERKKCPQRQESKC